MGSRDPQRVATDQSLTALVEHARNGDQQAWNHLVERFSPMVWAICRSRGLSRADAADVHASTWLRLVDNLDRIREPEHLGAWLRRTANNEAIAAGRRLTRSRATEPGWFDSAAPLASEIDGDLLRDEAVSHLRRTVAQLDDGCQLLLQLLYQEPRLSYREIAGMLGRPVGAIGPSRQRCLDKLRSLGGFIDRPDESMEVT